MKTSPQSNNNTTTMQRHPQQSMFRIYDGEYFEIVKRERDLLLVRCQTCGPDAMPLRSSAKSNGNILKHIKRRHPELLERIREQKNIKSRGYHMKSDPMDDTKKNSNHNVTAGGGRATTDGGYQLTSSLVDAKGDIQLHYVNEGTTSAIANDATNADTKYITTTASPLGDSAYAARITVHVKPPLDTKLNNHQPQDPLQLQTNVQQSAHVISVANTVGEPCNVEYLTVGAPTEKAVVSHQHPTVRRQRIGGNGAGAAGGAGGAQRQRRKKCTSELSVEELMMVDEDHGTAAEYVEEDEDELVDDVDEDELEMQMVDELHDDDENIMMDAVIDGATVSHTIEPLFGGVRKRTQARRHAATAGDLLTGGTSFLSATSGRYVSSNRQLDNDREIVKLRKRLMVREFLMVQQRHRLEIELLQRELEYKREQHKKTIQCLNQQLRDHH